MYHRSGGLNNRNLFLRVLEVKKSKTKALTDPETSESLPPGLQVAVFHCIFTQLRAKRDSISPPFSRRALISFMGTTSS